MPLARLQNTSKIGWANMQSRQRLLDALHHKETDRIPYDMVFTSRAKQRFASETGIVDLEGFLDLDYRYVLLPPPAALPDFSSYFAGKVPDWPSCDWENHGLTEFGSRQNYPHFFRLGERTCINEWGEYRIFDEDLSYHRKVHPLEGEQISIQQAYQFPFPNVSDESRFEGVETQVQSIHADQKAAVLFLEMTIFEKTWRLRGFETFLMDMVANPDLAEYLLDEVTRRSAAIAARCALTGVDIIQFGDDIGAEKAMLMRPALWRKVLKPRLAEVITAAKNANPGVLAFYHSDGFITPVVPDLIEIGVDILNPIQPEAVDIAFLRKEYGDYLCFWGGIGVQTTMPFGTPQEVRAAVTDLIHQAGSSGGLVVSPSHVVEHDVPAQNIVAFVESVREYRI